MSESKHTPGLRVGRDADGTVWVSAPKGSGLATCSFGAPEDAEDAARCERTAKLYASAPAMRAALEEIEKLANNLCEPTKMDFFWSIRETARAALLLARKGGGAC